MSENELNRTTELVISTPAQAGKTNRLTRVMQYLTTCDDVDRVSSIHDAYSIIFVDGTSFEQRKKILDHCDAILQGKVD